MGPHLTPGAHANAHDKRKAFESETVQRSPPRDLML